MPYFWVAPGIRFNDCLFTEPVPLASWRPPGCAGIAAILLRNPQWAPKPLQPLYFGEFGNNAAVTTTAPSLPKDARPEDFYISVMPMPFSTATQRRALSDELIASYNPACQNTGRPASMAELARKIDELESRQQEQGQEILSLLSYIAKLFEPLPVGPRKPIGFLPLLAPAGAGATETGS